MSQKRLWGVAIGCVCLAVSSPAHAAGQYKLAWWRQLGNYENAAGSGCTGNHVINVWVFDEGGNPKPNVQLKTTWDVLLGTTDVDGRSQVILDNNNTRYDMICVDGTGATSDVALEMSSRQRPCWGHYSYELGFLYKTDAANAGSFDTSLNCTLNPGCPDYGTCPEETDAPYTRSLAFNSINCADYHSDETAMSNWQQATSYFGQTFVATANRVIAMRGHGTIGGNYTLQFTAQIVTWPGLQPVGPAKSTPVEYPFGWVITWGVNDVPVTAGQTYMLKIWRDGSGMNTYHVIHNNYAAGQYYEGTTAFPGYELEAWVCCMDSGPPPAIHITAGPSVTGIRPASATITWDTDVPGSSQVDYGLTSTYGSVRSDSGAVTHHSLLLTGLTAQSQYHYRVTSAASGYATAVSGDLTFTTTIPGDFDGDGDVDQQDFGYFQACYTGPGLEPDAACSNARLDADADVDQDDLAIFQGCLSGAKVPAEAGCAD